MVTLTNKSNLKSSSTLASEMINFTNLKAQFIEKCSGISFEKLDDYFDNCLCLNIYYNKSIEDLRLQLKVLPLEKKNKYLTSFVNFGNPIPLYEEIYEILLNVLKSKEREGFVDDWDFFEQTYPQKSKKKQKKWQQQIINKRRKSINYYQNKKVRIFGNPKQKMEDEILPFKVFPKGELTTEQFIRKLKNNGINVISKGERSLRKIEETFDYKNRCVGEGDFKDYVVYRFTNTNVVIAEKPSYGNATYLIKGSWNEILKILQLSRGEARSLYANKVKRVIHNDEKQWLSNLKLEFNWWY